MQVRVVVMVLALCLAVGSSAFSMADDEATEEEARQLYERFLRVAPDRLQAVKAQVRAKLAAQ